MSIDTDTSTTPETAYSAEDQETIEMFGGKNEIEIRQIIHSRPDVAPRLNRFVELIEAANNPQSDPPVSATPPSPPPASSSQDVTEQGVVIEDDVQVTIKPSLLKSYAVNRSLPDAIKELVKGKDEADKTIKFFKDHKLPLLEQTVAQVTGENQSLKRQIEEWKTKQAAMAATAQKAIAPESPELPDEIDFLDPEHQKSIISSLKSYNSQINELKSTIDSLKAGPPAPPLPPNVSQAPQAPVSSPYEREFAEIRMVQAHPEFQALATRTDVAELDRQYSEFVTNMAQTMGVRDVYTPEGRYSPDVLRLLQEYDSQLSPQGKMIRDRCDAYSIKPPEEFDTLRKIYEIRRNAAKIGYEDAARLYLSKQPAPLPAPAPTALSMSEHDARQRAITNREQYVREPRPSEGAPMDSSSNELAEFNRLISKGRNTLAEQEVVQLRDYMKRLANMSDVEIDSWFRPIGR